MVLLLLLGSFLIGDFGYNTEAAPSEFRTTVPPAASETTYQQLNTNSISGHVSDIQRSPVADIRVELLNEVDTLIQTVKTNGSGLFIFRRLSAGVFQIRIQTAGTNYVSQTKRVDLARPHGLGSTSEEIDFILMTNRSGPPITKPGVIFVQDVPDSARKEFQRASVLIQESKREEGFEALKKALDIFPQYYDALDLMGTEQVKASKYEAAIDPLTKALQVNSKSYSSCLALGVAQYNLKLLLPAIESFKRAVHLNERSVNANLWLGIALRQTTRPNEAETYLRQADRLADGKLPDVHWQLALLYNQLKRYKEAADELEIFLKVQPDSQDQELIKKLIAKLRQQSAK